MSKRRSVFINVFVLILVQNGILAVLASRLTPNLDAVMMIALAAGVILLSMTTAMMATRIAGLYPSGRIPASMPAANESRQLDIKKIALDGKPEPTLVSLNDWRTPSAPIRLQLEKSLDEKDSERLRAAEDALSVLDGSLRRMAAGDLAARCEPEFADEFEGLRCDFNRALDALDDSMSEITLSASALHGECAEARLRLMQERQAASGELPQLSAASNGLMDIADVLRRHEGALAKAAETATTAIRHHAEERQAATTASVAAEVLSKTSTAATAAASATRDTAFRTNMLAVNINMAAAKGEATPDMLRSFAADLRAIAEDGAENARSLSLLERDITHATAEARNSFDRIAREDKAIDSGLKDIETTLADIREATGAFSDLTARTGCIVGDSSRSVARRKDLDHVLDTILARMAQELAVINRHCGRFIPVTLLRENAPPPENRPPRRGSHLRLIKN